MYGKLYYVRSISHGFLAYLSYKAMQIFLFFHFIEEEELSRNTMKRFIGYFAILLC
jgi:hypothetical protein